MATTPGNGITSKGTIRVLIAENEAEQRESLKAALSTRPEFDIVATVGHAERAALLASELRPDVAVVDMAMNHSSGMSLAERIVLDVPSCQVILLSNRDEPALMRRAMQTGAREFLTKPVDEEELIATVLRSYDLATRQPPSGMVETEKTITSLEDTQANQVIAVWGPKGGVGRTVIAVNLAVAMTLVARKRILLMDGCLGFCTADVALNIGTSHTILDLLHSSGRPDADLVSRVVVHHSSGLDVLLAPPVEAMLHIPPAQLQAILTIMRSLYDKIIIDTRPLLDETTVTLLDLADVILAVCNPDIASLRNLRIFLDAAGYLGFSPDKIRLTLNRHDMRGAIPKEEIEQICRCQVSWTIRNDSDAVFSSINRGEPVVSAQPQRPIAQELIQLASALAQVQSPSIVKTEQPRAATFERLFRRKRRN